MVPGLTRSTLWRGRRILRTLTRHRRTSMFFEIWVLWGDARSFALFASGCLGWLLLGCILALAGTVFVSPGLHFESFVSLWGDPETQRVRHIEKLSKNTKLETTWELNWELFGTPFETVASEVESASVLLHSFVSLFSRVFLAAFRSRFSEEIVESRRRPMCV